MCRFHYRTPGYGRKRTLIKYIKTRNDLSSRLILFTYSSCFWFLSLIPGWFKVLSVPIPVADSGFPGRGHQPLRLKNLLFDKIFAENCMKMKEIGPSEGVCIRSTPLDPPMSFHLVCLLSLPPSKDAWDGHAELTTPLDFAYYSTRVYWPKV